MARGRRAGSEPVPEPTAETPAPSSSHAHEGDEVIDPLRIAFEGLEDVQEEEGSVKGQAVQREELAPYDPLATLSAAMDEEDAGGGPVNDEPEQTQRRGLFGRRNRPKAEQGPMSAPLTPPVLNGEDPLATPAPVVPEPPAADAPRVTTWADDVADDTFAGQAWATGEIPRVVEETPAEEPEAEAVTEEAEAGTPEPAARRRRAGRRRRGAEDADEVDEPISDQPAEAEILENLELTDPETSEPVVHVEDAAWDTEEDGGEQPASFLTSYLGDEPSEDEPAQAAEPVTDDADRIAAE
ncbi:hypothetical protein, partial [Nocardioides marmorisolisilvae]